MGKPGPPHKRSMCLIADRDHGSHLQRVRLARVALCRSSRRRASGRTQPIKMAGSCNAAGAFAVG